MKQGYKRSCGCFKAENVRPKYKKDHHSWCGCGDLSGSQWRNILSSAKTRKIDVNLTMQEAWEIYKKQRGLCALSGVPITFGEPNVPIRRQNRTASLDRINSDKPYEMGNVQWIHKDVNYMKCWFDQNEFLTWCDRIMKHTHFNLEV